jgi:hypothetical protein
MYTEISKLNDLKLINIHSGNFFIFRNLAQAYEGEFSSLTHKIPNKDGLFEIDVIPYETPYVGFLLFYKDAPVGFNVIEVNDEFTDVMEFYIIPSMRQNKLGYYLAAATFFCK